MSNIYLPIIKGCCKSIWLCESTTDFNIDTVFEISVPNGKMTNKKLEIANKNSGTRSTTLIIFKKSYM